MAISVTNIATGSDTTAAASVSATVPVGGVPAGALIVVCVSEETGTVGGSVADTAGNTYARATSQVTGGTGNTNGQIFYAKNATALSSGNSITFTKNAAANNAVISAFYATGIDTSAPLDAGATATAPGNSAAPSVTSGAPAGAGELFVGVVAIAGASSDSFTQDATNGAYATPPTAVRSAAAGNDPKIVGGNLVNAGSGAKTYAPAITSRNWAAMIVAFKEPAAAGVTYPRLERGTRGLGRGLATESYH